MNIVKFKDILLDITSGLTEKQCELFNSKFRGKYAHAIDWTFCIPLEDITNEEVVRLSREFCIFNKTEETEPAEQAALYSLAPEEGSWNICTSLPTDLSKYEFLISYCKGDGSGAIVRGVNTTYLDAEKVSEGFSESMVEGNGKSLTLAAPALSMVFKIEAGAENKYYIYHEVEGEDGEITKMYLGNDSSGNILYGEKSNNSLWGLDFLDWSSNGAVTMTCGSGSKNILMYNTGSPRMKCYAESSATTSSAMKMDLSLYMRAADTPKEEPVLYFDIEEVRTYLGEKMVTTPIYNPFGVPVTYTSDNTDVATVEEDGAVRLVSVGECNILCTSEETDVYISTEASYHLVVRADKVDSEYSFTIPESTISCNVGDVLVNPAITPYDDVEYQETVYMSDDPSVADVDDEGNVSVKKEGVAEIRFLGMESEKYNDTDIYYTIQATYNPIKEYDWLPYDLLVNYVDIVETTKSNDVSKYITKNAYIPDTEVTLEDVRPFRTWLATCVLEMGTVEEYKTQEMLKYYKNLMYDDTIRHLSEFNQVSTVTSVTTSTCGCTKLPSASISGYCDVIQSYARSLHDYMVQIFSDLDFWLAMDEDFLLDISKYIDTIIAYDLPLASSVWDDVLRSCGCQDISMQESLMGVLKNTSKAFRYMAQGEIEGNKNFIKTSLYEFSSKVYEKMYWV